MCGDVGAVRAPQSGMGKSRSSRHIKYVVVEVGAFGPAVPIRKKYEIHASPWPDVNCIVVNQGIGYRPGNVDAACAIILTDVIAHDGSGIPHALLAAVTAFVADQEKPTVVVVTVVVLDNGIPAVPVRIVAFTVALPFCSVSFVMLNHCIVRAPSPDGHVVSLGTLIGVTHYVVFHHRTVRCHNHNPVSTYVVQVISANDNAQARKPFRAHPRIRPPEDPATVHVVNLVVLNSQ